MQGRRIPTPPTEWESGKCPYQPGDYWPDENGWHCCTPNGLVGVLTRHAVVEHEDGTITVSPSILTTNGTLTYHGYLERGVWRDC